MSLQQHDVQLDYYGKRLATCSSDRMIKIFDVSPDQTHHQLSATIQAHEGPVWQVAWAHPKFGSILASCSYDRKVCVWKETQPQQWSKVYEYADHQSSVNSISFAPHELGLKIAAASADGTLSILTWRGPQDNVWEEKPIHNAHQIGCNAVSWAPAAAPGSATGSNMIQVVSSWWCSCMMC
jgi:protein transport protein SEC13